MQTHDLVQGSDAWHAHRLQHWNASDAPAMMGCSPHKTRTQLLQELQSGITADVDPATQRRFDDGHRFEALARPLAEAILGEDLYPVTGSLGKLSASFDGLTMAEDTAFEHKTHQRRVVRRRCTMAPGLCAAAELPRADGAAADGVWRRPGAFHGVQVEG
jgi:predicted phage-related endonuclease